MNEVEPHPQAEPLSRELIQELLAVTRDETGDQAPERIAFRHVHSNDIAELHFADGRTLIVKRGRYPWAADRFRTTRATSRLLSRHTDIVAPRPLALPEHLAAEPLQVYWRIDLPTLGEIWSELSNPDRVAAVQSWGQMMAEMHHVRLPGCGALPDAAHMRKPLAEFLMSDLGERLFPAIAGEWPGSLWMVERMISLVPFAAERAGPHEGTLVHNDLHTGNVLCSRENGQFRCVGLIDLEAAQSLTPEADVASALILNDPLFLGLLPGDWLPRIQQSYPAPLDPWLLGFFRVNHLLNLGFYSALVGHVEHAAMVEERTRSELAWLEATLERAAS